MMRRSILFLLAMAGLTFFVSCSPNSQKTEPGPPDSKPTLTSQGTADSGGGNTLLGKPLESYKVKVRKLEVYKNLVSPIVDSKALQGTRLGQAMKTIMADKIWYFVPTELKQLSAEQIGSAVESDQAVLHDFKQVWWNSLIFDKMEKSEQATLIVHEIVMGLKLLKLDSLKAECLAFQSDFRSNDLQSCYNQSDKPRGKPSDLTAADYAQIRSATALIMEKGAQLSLLDWEELLGSHGIMDLTIKKTISLNELSKMLEATKLMKTWPQYGYDLGKFYSENLELLKSNPAQFDGKELHSDQACDFDLQIENDQFSFVLRESGQAVVYSTPWTSPIEMNLVRDPFSSFLVYSVGSPTLKLNKEPKKGDEVAFVELRFVGQLLLGVEIRKTVCLDENCTTSGQGMDGYFLSCYTKPGVTLNMSPRK